MACEVLLTADAVRDLEQITDWIARNDGPRKAEHVMRRLEAAIERLATYPAKGPYPPELLDLGIREYRETLFKPYRIIYRIAGKRVYVYLIADGRRDMQSLLARRLLSQ